MIAEHWDGKRVEQVGMCGGRYFAILN